VKVRKCTCRFFAPRLLFLLSLSLSLSLSLACLCVCVALCVLLYLLVNMLPTLLRVSTTSCSCIVTRRSFSFVPRTLTVPEHQREEQLQRLIELVHRSQRILVVSGAGLSTESNIPDYRGEFGSYRHGHKPTLYVRTHEASLLVRWLRLCYPTLTKPQACKSSSTTSHNVVDTGLAA